MIALILMIIPSIHCSTDITLLNCPSQFNISKANITTAQDVSLINTFYSGFSSNVDNARIENIVVSGDTDDLWSAQKSDVETLQYEIEALYVIQLAYPSRYNILSWNSILHCNSLNEKLYIIHKVLAVQFARCSRIRRSRQWMGWIPRSQV